MGTRYSLVHDNTQIVFCRFLIYDADNFTRKYFKEILNIPQKDSIDVSKKPLPPPAAVSKSVHTD
jgi:hypothetical protein